MGKESWDLTSGLLDDFDLEVKEAWFGEDEDSEGDRIYLFLRGPAESDDGDEEEEYRERFGTGKNWEVVDGGKGAEKATGKDKFDKRSGVGRLIRSFVEIGDGVAEALMDRGDANEAATYVGLKIHFVREVVSTWTDDDGDRVEWEMPLATAVEFPKKKKKKDKGGGGKKAESGESDKLTKVVAAFAKQFEDDEHTMFVEQVLDSDIFPRADEIDDDDELHADILDDEGKVWSKSH